MPLNRTEGLVINAVTVTGRSNPRYYDQTFRLIQYNPLNLSVLATFYLEEGGGGGGGSCDTQQPQ